MKLLFKQRAFSWLGSYDVFDEDENTVYTIEGQFSFGKRLHILDGEGKLIAVLKRRLMTFLPTFDLYMGNEEEYLGSVTKEFSLFRPSFSIDYMGWRVEGDIFEWDYDIFEENTERVVATVSKELLRFTDTYCMEVWKAEDALHVLMLVLAIDAEKESRN